MFSIGLFDAPIEGDLLSKEVLGGKGYGLANMASWGLNVPPAVIVPTADCVKYMNASQLGKTEIINDLKDGFFQKYLPMFVAKFGYIPLFSVRSGARVSMPGMMDTILNVGIEDTNFADLSKRIGEDAASDCRTRLAHMWNDVVGGDVPAYFEDQVAFAIKAVFDSWNNDRAVEYRKMNGYSDDWGTAVVIQSMVFGNLNNHSCSGVAFTRCPATGENKHVGEFLPNAQGEDVVAGTHTPYDIAELASWNFVVADKLTDTLANLEKLGGDVQDVEFTVQDGELFILQTRDAKRSPEAAAKIAWDRYNEGLWSLETALAKLSLSQYLSLGSVKITHEPDVIGTGIAAGGSIVIGAAAFTPEDAVARAKDGPVILIRNETTPDDLKGMAASVGILTQTGGKTSHAAVVSRSLGKTCVCGLSTISVTDSVAHVDVGLFIEPGDQVAIDGTTGKFWAVTGSTQIPTVEDASAYHEGHMLLAKLAHQQGVQLVSDDELHAYTNVLRVTSVKSLAKLLPKVAKSPTVQIDLRPLREAGSESETELFGLADFDVHHLDLQDAAVAWEAKNAKGLTYLVSEKTSSLNAPSCSDSLDALFGDQPVKFSPGFASQEALQKIIAALKLAGHDVPEVTTGFADSIYMDEFAFQSLVGA
jgi:phosphoenolpyruvate synthase/pyruvate phosphate dikinase